MQQVGEQVLAPWGEDGFLYPAVVVGVGGAGAALAFFDGDQASVPVARMRPCELEEGSAVEANWRGKGRYYGGVIARRCGAAVFVHFNDGDKEWLTIAQVRVRASA